MTTEHTATAESDSEALGGAHGGREWHPLVLDALTGALARAGRMVTHAERQAATTAILDALSGAGALLSPGAETVTECQIDWVDERSPHGRSDGAAYRWRVDTAAGHLADVIAARAELRQVPVMIRQRTVSTWPDGLTVTGRWIAR
ncbi:hypothetical protein [Rhizomonospora bruguierae]|uniref:hypothetical protein n=1 Tax=Rhizomonospora bruguierae TaxID=1581705 RepID=UPI001BCCAA80|nr:hypothetical protein [Micromonospora sp. NBRC 107566]